MIDTSKKKTLPIYNTIELKRAEAAPLKERIVLVNQTITYNAIDIAEFKQSFVLLQS